MDVKNKINFFFLKDLFFNVYSLSTIYKERDTLNENIIVPLSAEDLKKKLIWYRVLDHTKNYSQIQDWLQEISRKKVLYPQYSYIPSFPGYDLGYINIVIYERDFFHFNVHLKLNKNLTNTYNLIIVFSTWVEGPLKIDDLNLNYINTIYNDLLIGFRIINKLEDLGYSKISLFEIEKYRVENYNLTKQWLKNKPLIFITNSLELLNANPFKLIQDFQCNLEELDSFIKKIEKEIYNDSLQFFNYFSDELKNFLLKGKALFHIAEGSLDFISNIKQEKIQGSIILKNERKSTGLDSDTLLELFNIAYENDKKDGVSIEKRGYRSLSKIYEDFGKKYNFSKQTVYNCFNNSVLESVLEKRIREDRGGGIEYRIKKIELIEDIRVEDLNENFMYEKMKIERALICYNKKEFQNCINIFHDVLKSSSEILKENLNLYLGSKFYLAKAFFKSENYEEAFKILEDINKENEYLFDVNYYLMLCYLKLLNYDSLQKLIQFNINNIEKIFNSFGIQYELNKLRERIFNKKDFAQKMTKDDDLTKYILLINKVKLDKRYGKWNVYNFPSKKEKNSIAFDRLRKSLETALILQIELFRKMIFHYVLENKVSTIQLNINKLIELLTSEIYNNMFDNDYFFHYLHYFIFLLRHHLKEFDLKQFIDEIKKRLPTIRLERHNYGQFPKEFDTFSVYINKTNDLYYSQKEDPRINFLNDFDPKEPDLTFEKIYTEGYLIEEYGVLDRAINKNQEGLNKIEKINDVEGLFDLWERFFFPFLNYGSANKLIDNYIIAKDICKRHNFANLIKHLDSIYQNITEKVKKINNLKEKGKFGAIRKIFEILSKEYKYLDREKILLNFDESPEEIDIDDFIFDKAIPNIEKKIPNNNYNGKFELEINLPNKKITEIVFNYYKDRSKGIKFEDYDYILPYLISDSQILLKNESIVRYVEKNPFEDNVYNILECIINVIKRNFNYLIVKSKKLQDELFFKDFKKRILDELDNDFFSFNIKKTKKKNEIIFLIQEKSKNN